MTPARPATRPALALRGAVLALAASAGLLATAPPARAELSPRLAVRVLESAPAERIPVIATLSHQVDPSDFTSRPEVLMRALHELASGGQGLLQARLAAELGESVRHFWLVNALAGALTPAGVVALASDPAVASVSLDEPARLADQASPAPSPTPAAGGDWGLADIEVPAARQAAGVTGAGVRVGSIDTGVDPTNPALAGKIAAWHDFVNGRPTPYDDNGHGTHTIGTMIGSSVDGAPIGVAPGATVVVAKALSADGDGDGSDLLEAAQWITDPDGNPATADQPAVINNSWTTGDPENPWFRQVVRSWVALGIVPVFAAGNGGPASGTVENPASYPESLSVGALAQDESVAPFSGRGPVVWQDPDGTGPGAGTALLKPDLTAPGTDILSSVPGGYQAESGTSMAAPHVAGVVALLKQAQPSLGPAAIEAILRQTAKDLGPAGPDPGYGAGEVDAAAAVAAALGTPGSPGTPGTPGIPATPAVPGTPDTAIVGGPGPFSDRPTTTYRVATANASLVRDRVDGGAWSEPAPGPTVALALTPGPHTVEFQSVDAAGAVDPTPASSRVTVDLSPPRVRLVMRSDGARTVLRASAVDALTGVDPSSFRWTFGDGSTATGPLVRRRFGAARAGRVRLTVMDMAGNVGTFDTLIPAPAPAARDASPQADHGSRQFAERRSGGSRRRGRPAKRGHRSHRGFQA